MEPVSIIPGRRFERI